jgi:hypothetical protein
VPCIFGVLTVMDKEQAIVRSVGEYQSTALSLYHPLMRNDEISV